jgi:hypothetical protein
MKALQAGVSALIIDSAGKQRLMINAAGQDHDQRSTLPLAVAVGRGFPAVVEDCGGWEMVVLTR